MGARVVAALVLATATACVFPVRRGGDEGPIRAAGTPAPEADPSRTAVALLTSEPIEEGKNLLWSAGMQLAWDELGHAIGVETVELGPPASPVVVAALGRQRFPKGDLDPESVVVESGFSGQGVAQRFAKRLAAMGERSRLPAYPAAPDDIVALAFVRKDLPFAHPFHVHRDRLAFAGGPARVVAFGIDAEATGQDANRIAAQALVHDAPEGAGADDLVVELLPRDDADRIVLAAMARPASLDAGWARVQALLAREATPLHAGFDLRVPKVDFAATREFTELVGAPVAALPGGSKLLDARERIELTLSERGARFVSEASVVASCSAKPIPRRIHFDRPFLLALVRRGASRPYFVGWLGNDDLFVRD